MLRLMSKKEIKLLKFEVEKLYKENPEPLERNIDQIQDGIDTIKADITEDDSEFYIAFLTMITLKKPVENSLVIVGTDEREIHYCEYKKGCFIRRDGKPLKQRIYIWKYDNSIEKLPSDHV